MGAILEVRNLSKRFNQLLAVDGISFAIPAGICFGLLGPNGAGKTTTIEMIEGITEPGGGEILYRGRPRDRTFAQQAGIQFQQTALMDFLTVRETLKLFASFYHHPADIDELVETCHLGEFLDNYATKLSGGQQQRLLLALALINNPEIVFLDEPTTGLDPQARRNFWKLIGNIRGRGKTVVLTTHYMEEAETLCDYLVIVDHGRIIAEGRPRDLLHEHFRGTCILLQRNALNIDPESLGIEYQLGEEEVELFTESVEQTIALLIERGASLDSLSVRPPSLEDLFLKLTGHSLRN
jgi:ABC-2 type transport system ATP-binding protein